MRSKNVLDSELSNFLSISIEQDFLSMIYSIWSNSVGGGIETERLARIQDISWRNRGGAYGERGSWQTEVYCNFQFWRYW